jgi:GT2 family glycosyltransferase
MNTPESVAVIISTYNEERHIDACLNALLAQTVPVRIVVVDGGSRDRTLARLRTRASEDRRIEVYADGIRRNLPDALNLAIQLCSETYIAKVDARTFILPDFLERALAVFAREDSTVACVGGRPEQFGETTFGEGVARARMSRFGVGGSGYADSRETADVDTVQCGIYRREALNAIGGFDADLQFGEDEELNWRLRQAGYRIVLDARIRFRYLTRSTWLAAFAQYRNYGRARVSVVEKHPEFLRIRHLAPSALVAAAALLVCAAPLIPGARAVAYSLGFTYMLGALYAATVASRDRYCYIPHTAAAFSALHFGYGVGLLEGIYARAKRSFAQ